MAGIVSVIFSSDEMLAVLSAAGFLYATLVNIRAWRRTPAHETVPRFLFLAGSVVCGIYVVVYGAVTLQVDRLLGLDVGVTLFRPIGPLLSAVWGMTVDLLSSRAREREVVLERVDQLVADLVDLRLQLDKLNVIPSSEAGETAVKHARRYMAVAKVQQLVARLFDGNELRMLSVAVGADFENLPGDVPKQKALSLVSWSERAGRLDKLVEACALERPYINWEL